MVSIIDYHCGNLGSIANMLKKLGHQSEFISTPSQIELASKIILPGVGSYDYGMTKLKELNLIDGLNKRVLQDKIPVLGVCLGAQLMCEKSEEGVLPGLGWIKADVRRFPHLVAGVRFAVPHMGWDNVTPTKASQLFFDLEKPRFYFVHSYYIQCYNETDILSKSNYGNEFVSSYECDHIIGVQFHPEKSHKYGKQIYKNFLENY